MEQVMPPEWPKVLASNCAVDEIDGKGRSGDSLASGRQGHTQGHFKSAQWTADGTSVITDSADNRVRTFVIPPDLLEKRDNELWLKSYSEIQFAEAVKAITTYPLFDLQDPSTTLLLCSVPDHPIGLRSALSSELFASYPFVHATTEAYISPHSLAFTGDGRRFISGSKNLLAVFDVSRPGEGPMSLLPTAHSRRAHKPSSSMSIGMKGIVSALSIETTSSVLAAGTFSRHVGLYSASGQGESLGVFRVDGNEADCRVGGGGITQLRWSPCGRYLYIVERCSRGVMVYDIRKTGQLLSWAEGRSAETNQRMGVDLHTSADGGLEIWAGGVDGRIRIWKNTHCQEGGQQPDLAWLAHQDAVSGTIVHRSGSVVATCSGQRHFPQSDMGDSDEDSQHDPGIIGKSEHDNSLKIWQCEPI